uniref:Uncharacterized protein n=1 Tax=Arundo donax TaxID=35708 RepID=A0A0A9APJ9_ARUDO
MEKQGERATLAKGRNENEVL